MQQREDGRIIGLIDSDTVDPAQYDIDPLGAQEFGYLETTEHPRDDQDYVYSSLDPNSSRCNSLVADIEFRILRRPVSNVQRNDTYSKLRRCLPIYFCIILLLLYICIK